MTLSKDLSNAPLGGGLVGQGLEKDVQEVERHYAELAKERDELEAELARELTEEAVNSLEQLREDMVAGRQPDIRGQAARFGAFAD